ncbi:MAG: hypothetical protein OXI90_07960 [Gammaproteobacteria bacterium]|nr:hypothetical protein [Gammaproteobacteria bacterium]
MMGLWSTFVGGCLVLGVPAHGADDTTAWERETYVLSVGEMEILHDVNTDDTWSPAPDLVVRVSRSDPEVSRQIRRLEIANERREERRRKVASARDELREQREESARESVEPLTGEQTERLSTLLAEVGDTCEKSRAVCGGCPGEADFDTCQACAKCPELELLQWRQSESERVPIPPLTERQLQRLEDHEEEVLALVMEIEATEKEVTNLKRLIYGASRQIETHRLIVDFRDHDVIRVHPGDRITVSVWDNDVFNDDLYGRTTVTLDRATLERGTLDVSMPNIKFVRLRFRRDETRSIGN